MKVRIDIPQAFCKAVTHPKTMRDEIYMAYYITLAKRAEDKTLVRKYVTKKISDVKTRVKRKSRWIPTETMTVLDVGDAEALFINMGLFERDNGVIYKKMKTSSDVLVTPDDFDWSLVEIPTDMTNYFSWIKSVWKLSVGAFNYFMQDDLIGTKSIVISNLKNEADRTWEGVRELKFKGYGADYRLSFVMMEDKY